MSTSVTMMLNNNAGATEMPTLLVKAKFHYTDTDTDTDPTGPARTRTDFFRGETPLGPCGSGRVRVVEFSSYSTTCADFVGDPGPVGSV